jgi:hypothetical protein
MFNSLGGKWNAWHSARAGQQLLAQQALCHCSYTCEHLLFILVCSEPAHMQCSSVQGKMQSPLFSAALQNRLTAGTVSLTLHLWSFALHTDVQ